MVRAAKLTTERPKRGAPKDTRSRLVQAAAEVFNRDGYEGTDSNRIAREAGYSPGTFYKHFSDKKEVFIAVYEEWVLREWKDVSEQSTAEAIVRISLEHHRRWRGFRGSLRALVTYDADIRRVYRAQRKTQLEWLGGVREEDALLLYTIERTADAFADNEPDALGLDRAALRRLLEDLVRKRLMASGPRE